MDNQVVYELLLKDGFSPGLANADKNVEKFESHLGHLKETAMGVMEGIGLAFAGFEIFKFIGEGREDVEKLHQAEAALTNTMENMGNYSEEAFEKSVKGAYDLSHGIKFTQTQIVGLQSELGLVGNIGEGEMNRLIKVSADLSTKFGMGLNEAGNLLAKAINNPEMARRLGMALKIDPAVMAHIQDLAKHGKEAEARMELLAIAEDKVGGAAEAAFGADPMAKFDKDLYDTKLIVGQLAMDFLKLLIPALQFFVNLIKDAASWVKEHKEVLSELAIGLGVAAVAVGAYTLIVNAAAIAETLAATATSIWNAALEANPIIAVIALIALLVAAVINAYKHFETFHAILWGVWSFIKEFGSIVADIFIGLGKVIEGAITFNPALIIEGGKQAINAIADAGTRMGQAFQKGFEEGKADFNKVDSESLIPKGKNKSLTGPIVPPKIDQPKTKAVGSKSVTINVSIKDLIGTYNSNVTNLKEGGKQLKDIVVSVLEDALNDFQIVATH